MLEVRLAQKGEIIRQKEIWKLCFGDPDDYIDFYYAHRYKEDETVLLLEEGEIFAMLTMIPVQTVTPGNRIINTVMLYAIATDPPKQNRGYATYLMNFCDQYFKANNQDLSIVVPAREQLFNFYSRRGYRNGFYIRELRLTREMAASLPMRKACRCSMAPLTAGEYNCRRNQLLGGRLYIAYRDEDIDYQKKLSVQSGVDLYGLDCGNMQGCAAIEKASGDRMLIKELMVHEEFFNEVIGHIARQLYAKEYILRTPAYLGEHLGGRIHPLAMVKIHKEVDVLNTAEELGYLGFAFD